MAVNTEESSLEGNIILTSPPDFKVTRNVTGGDEQSVWWYLKRWSKDWKGCYHNHSVPYDTSKETVRRRRWSWSGLRGVAFRSRFENSDEIGTFVKLTNSYCLLCYEEDSLTFLRTVKGDLPEIPIINTTLAGCRVVGRMCVGNRKGLLLPETVCDTELQQVRNDLPDSVEVKKIEERLSALGNVIACNDSVALVHPDIDKETEEAIADTLQVEVFRHMINNNPLVGSYCVLNNRGGLVPPGGSKNDLENLSSVLQVPLVVGTVNHGSNVLASGLVVNDRIAYAGMKTTSHEFSVIESAFHL